MTTSRNGAQAPSDRKAVTDEATRKGYDMKSILKPGDRVAYAAAFLKNTGQQTGNAGERRGTYLRPDPRMPKYGYVRWDDEAELIAAGQGDYAEADYCDAVRRDGNLVCLPNIARVGSPRFALNDL